MITTTLNKIREHSPCESGWKKLLAYLGKTEADDEPLALLTILESNGLWDAIWVFRTLPEYSATWRHYTVDCVEHVKHLLKDPRSLEALRIARLHADGLATDEQLTQARNAAATALADAYVTCAAALADAVTAVTADAVTADAAAAYAAADAVAYAAAAAAATATTYATTYAAAAAYAAADAAAAATYADADADADADAAADAADAAADAATYAAATAAATAARDAATATYAIAAAAADIDAEREWQANRLRKYLS